VGDVNGDLRRLAAAWRDLLRDLHRAGAFRPVVWAAGRLGRLVRWLGR
jgi:hypothetical protein